jgi:hypothetical protein
MLVNKARGCQSGAPHDVPCWAKLLALPANISPGACIIKLIMAVIYGFRDKLDCLYLNTRLSLKGLPGTNTIAYYENRKLRP